MQVLLNVSHYRVFQPFTGCSSPIAYHLRLLYLKTPFANCLLYTNFLSRIYLNSSPDPSNNTHFPITLPRGTGTPYRLTCLATGYALASRLSPWRFPLANVTCFSASPTKQITTLFRTTRKLKSTPTTYSTGAVPNSRTKSSQILFTYHLPPWVRRITPTQRQPQ
jgi:hypothetical protein